MAIFADENTKVVVQGLTGSQGSFYGLRNRAYGTKVVAGTNPKKAGTDVEGIPIFGSVRDAKHHTGATVSVIYVPPPGAAAAIWEAVEADLDLVICITEGIPVRDMMEVKDRMAKAGGGTLH